MTPTTRRDFLVGTAAAIAIRPELSLASPPRLAADVRAGVVGTGRQGRAILAELAKFEQVEVSAICDVDERRLKSAGRRAPGAASYATHAELIDIGRCDVVFVATPTHEHRSVAVDALSASRHVYCESPLAHTVEDARAIASAARGAGTVFQTGLLGRSNPIYSLARSFVRSGAIREVVSMRAQWRSKTSWRTPSNEPEREKRLNWRLDPEVSIGLAGELGTQQFDVIHWFTGKYPETVRGSGGVLAWKDGRTVADTIQCELGFPGGTRLSYEATLGNSFEGEYEVLAGTMGAVKLAWTAGWLFKEADAATQGWEVYANRQRLYGDEGITLIADATKLAAQGKLTDGIGLPNPPVYYGVEDFLKSVTEEKEIACSAEEGLRAAVVGILANQAVTSGSEVAIDPALFKAE